MARACGSVDGLHGLRRGALGVALSVGGAALGGAAEAADGLHRMKPVIIYDRFWGQGGELPLARILAPAGWRVSGGMRWVRDTQCDGDVRQIRWSAISPDGRYAFHIRHGGGWFSGRPPGALAMVVPGMKPCAQVRAQTPVDFLGHVARRDYPRVRLDRLEPDPGLTARLAYQNRDLRVPNAPQVTTRFGGARALGRYRKAGQVYEAMMVMAASTTRISVPPRYGAPAYRFTAGAGGPVLVMTAPAGRLDGGLFAAIAGSITINPAWARALLEHEIKVARIRIREAGRRQQILTELNAALIEIQSSVFAERQKALDRIHDRFVARIRDQTAYTTPDGKKVMVPSSAKGVWSVGGQVLISTGSANPANLPSGAVPLRPVY